MANRASMPPMRLLPMKPTVGVGTLGEHLAGRALTLDQGHARAENLGTATFKIVGAPHMTPYMVSIGP
jgi:hypothetical protein